jgi:predicted lipid carrier protein YhbT
LRKIKQKEHAMKRLSAAILLAAAPLAVAGNNAGYPVEKVPTFVAQQLDVTTFPPELRPKHEKGKKTLGEYRFVTRNVDDKVLEAVRGTTQLTITVLEQNRSGIYVCANGPAQNAGDARFQRVLLLKRKNPDSLLKSNEALKEFKSCPTIGEDPNESIQNN